MELIQSGQVKAADLVWNESMSDLTASEKVPELAPAEVSPPEGGEEKATPPPMPKSPVLTAAPVQAPSEHLPNYLWQSIVGLNLVSALRIADATL